MSASQLEETGVEVAKLPHEWSVWLAENRLAGTQDDILVSTLIEANFEPAAASAAIASLDEDPVYLVARRATQQLRKVQSTLDIRRTLSDIAFPAASIERRTDVTPTEFLERYYSANRPVILSAILGTSRACQSWTPEYLAQLCGDARVEIMAERNSDAEYEVNANSHKRCVTMAEYVRMVTEGGPSNDYYLVANNGFLDLPETQRLRAEVPQLPEFLDPANAQRKIFFWFGPGGTVTPLHHDIMNIFAAQVLGRKRFTLIPPEQTAFVYNKVGVFGEVDCRNPDYTHHPLYAQATPIEVIIEPGDILFIPVGWWHYVEGLETSIMISYINFRFPNEFTWNNPSIL
jgi:ribosomal protein L16 Arg81 hydroxylase